METQGQRIVRHNREGKYGGGSLHISLNGFSADTFFKNKKELKKALRIFLKESDNIYEKLTSLTKS